MPQNTNIHNADKNSNLDPKVGADTSEEVPDAYVEAPIPTDQLLHISPLEKIRSSRS